MDNRALLCFSFTSSSLIQNPSISFSCLLALAKTSNTMLNEGGESGHLCLIPDPREKTFIFSTSNMMGAVGLSHVVFIMLKYDPSMPLVGEFLSWMDVRQSSEFDLGDMGLYILI